ncbi:MAG: hypothetical protein CMJ78_05135 [Planctomycetaceae bacterium]|nr:hypothetical protein [Planctomycetaceae bacterium]
MPTEVETPPPISRAEKLAVGAVLLIGIAARLAFPSHMAIEHFDEGVYASNIYSPNFRYPAAEFYAPPLLPAMIEWSIIFAGPRFGPFIFPLACSIGTLVLVWHVGRQWFSPGTGLCALILASLSDFHMHYSRMALTDAPMCFFLLLAVYLTGEALARAMKFATQRNDTEATAKSKSRKHGKRPADDAEPEMPNANLWIVGAGLVTALCWWTKYNGWLPIAIAIAGTCGWLVASWWRKELPEKPTLVALLTAVAVSSFVALLAWIPFLWTLPDGTSYGDISGNHSRYIVGFNGWWESFLRHFAHHHELNGWVTALCVTVLVIAETIQRGVKQRRYLWDILLRVLGVTGCGLLCGVYFGPTTVLLVVAGMLVVRFFARNLFRRKALPEHSIRRWLLVTWWVGLLLTTPLYSAYPRLSLPWLVVTWLLASELTPRQISWRECLSTFDEDRPHQISFANAIINCLACVGLMTITVQKVTETKKSFVTAWADRSSALNIAEEFQSEHPNDVAFVYGEPPLFFNLSAAGVTSAPIAGLASIEDADAGGARKVVFLGPHARAGDGFTDEFKKAGDDIQLLKAYELHRSPVVLANDPDPIALFIQDVRVYEIKK